MTHLFYSTPDQPIIDHGPTRPETAFGILPFDKIMSLLSEAMLSVRVTPSARVNLSRKCTCCGGLVNRTILIIRRFGLTTSDLVIETGDHQMVISMQPQYEDDKEDWLLGILLNNEGG
ncbi:hypothetical protein L226DRAFT_520361 [Lentinus tigrinus ALCF2SS1-7]|uniref:uncharacterized protein n=1 Tax=Lentinus tigrinus ALCF2SS1-7 TaxID=1328758 RepID=UPI0011661014|nr:hypothetical protein L226DRAFT_520361 [Lentinus tigrinus ALCF2SS1-7]